MLAPDLLLLIYKQQEGDKSRSLSFEKSDLVERATVARERISPVDARP